jgi:selenocysteine-specific elongation factor
MATVSLLDCDAVAPGQWGLAQLFLDEPAMAVWGQPFVVRSSSGMETLGGGQVLQPTARKVRRRHLDVLERIERLWTGDLDERAFTVAWFGGFAGATPADLVRGAGVSPDQAGPILARLQEGSRLKEVALGQGRRRLLHAEMLAELEGRLLAVLTRLHEESPLMSSHDRQKVQAQLDYVGDDALVHAAVERLLQEKKLVGDLRRVARAEFKPKLSNNQKRLKERIITAYRDQRFQPPEPEEFANQAGGNAGSLYDLLEVCVAEGHLIRIVDTLYLHSDVEAVMRQLVHDRLTAGGGLTVAEIRDLLGTTRKYAVPLCEYLDRIGVTRREGDLRLAGPAVALRS